MHYTVKIDVVLADFVINKRDYSRLIESDTSTTDLITSCDFFQDEKEIEMKYAILLIL